MKNVWKWILGILGVLVLAVLLIGLPYLAHTTFGVDGFRSSGTFYGPQMMTGRGFHMTGVYPMMGGMMFLMGFRWLLPLLGIGLLVYGAYRYGRRNSLPSTPAVPVQTCPKCGQPVQAGWNNCASCGKKIA